MSKKGDRGKTVSISSVNEEGIKTLYVSPSSDPEAEILLPKKMDRISFSISPSLPKNKAGKVLIEKKQEISCQDAAKYLLSLADEDAGDLISNLKIQKLVYYAQGFHLAIFDRPLFEERIEAWAHGPVVPDLYHMYKNYGREGIPIPPYIDFSIYSEDVKSLLNDVYSVYGQFSAWKLRNMTHSEPPWKNAIDSNRVISNSSLKKYFLTQIED